MKLTKSDERGLGFKLCITCERNDRFVYSSPRIVRAYEINSRAVDHEGSAGKMKVVGIIEML